MNKGKIILIPVPISEDSANTIPEHTTLSIRNVKVFVVERLRTARRWLKTIDKDIDIDAISFFELDKHQEQPELITFLNSHIESQDIGVMSEAGCPGVADPGHVVVQWAHNHGITVVPLVGPSSILLALMASGLNGQNFTFHGYLPNKKPELAKKLKELEIAINKQTQTQIFMDAPYRNAFLMEACVECVPSDIMMTIACDINANTEWIQTRPIKNWKKFDFNIFHKRPAIILLGKY